jgi:hypothetical protein
MPRKAVQVSRCVAAFLAASIALTTAAHEKRDMELVGFHDLQRRGAYQPVIQKQGARWIAYVGHHAGGDNGTSVLDVTDASAPTLLAHIRGEGEGAQMARVCAIRGKHYLLRSLGHTAHELWDVTLPAKPARVSTVAKGLGGTHKSWWECDSGIAYLVSGAPGWRTDRMTQVFDLSDPGRPRFIRDFGLAGQQPGAQGDVPTGLHGPISTGAAGNRIYFGYGTNRGGVLQIVDRDKLLKGPGEPTAANLAYPQVARLDLPISMGAHTTFPLLGMELTEFARDKAGRKRDFVFVVNEALASGCAETRQMAWIVEVTDEARPFGVSSWTVPEASGNFCAREGRFGAHSSNESFTPAFYRRLVFVAFFNAGVRAIDVRDPYHPVEVAHFIPKGAHHTNNVEVDDRGYVYIVDRANAGMHILRLTGEARKIANLP